MPCYLITLHAYGSWWPDRPRGYVRRGEGVLPPDPEMADRYRRAAKFDEATFRRRVQELIVREVLAAAEPQAFRVHMVSHEPTHVHVLCSWRTHHTARSRRRTIKASLTYRLNKTVERRQWFARGGSVKKVAGRPHFDHLMHEYLPAHDGLKWREGDGYFT